MFTEGRNHGFTEGQAESSKAPLFQNGAINIKEDSKEFKYRTLQQHGLQRKKYRTNWQIWNYEI